MMCLSYTYFRENGFLTVSKMPLHLLMLRAKATCSVNYSSVFSSERLSLFNLSLFLGEDSPGKNTGVSCHALLQGIFPVQGLNPALPHCRQILYCLSHQRSPMTKILNSIMPVQGTVKTWLQDNLLQLVAYLLCLLSSKLKELHFSWSKKKVILFKRADVT